MIKLLQKKPLGGGGPSPGVRKLGCLTNLQQSYSRTWALFPPLQQLRMELDLFKSSYHFLTLDI